jgi:hypothetical protein
MWVGRTGLGPPPRRFVGLLGGDLVGHSALQACSMGTWSVAPPRRLAWRGLDRSLRLAQGCSANGPEGGHGPTSGTLFTGTRHVDSLTQLPNISATLLSSDHLLY